ncbi:Cysteine-rich receptor-like protein kinase 10, partial [Bienertia sinuspersici]
GYISPEYFAEGLFSDKSDVFSLGVVILEIISGRKSSSFWNHECLNLVTYTWELWKNNDPLKLVDPAITVDPCIRSQILKCIHLGLLCVQHYAEDRPTMTILVSMLDVNNTMELPYPKQPGHLQVRPPSSNNEALRSHQENG